MLELMEDGSQIHHMTLYFCPNAPVMPQNHFPFPTGMVIPCAAPEHDERGTKAFAFLAWARQGCRMVAGYEHMDAMSKNHKISFPDGTGIAIGAQSPYKCDGALLTLRAPDFGSGGRFGRTG